MRTNIEIDDALLGRFMAAVGIKTKREAVDVALRDALLLRQQEALMSLRGIGWEGDLDEMRMDKPLPEFE